METVTVEINWHDPAALQAVGLRLPQPAAIQCLPGAIPATGDVIAHADVNYPGGKERARFRVVSRAHLFGGGSVQRVQLNVELLVLHQP